MLDQLQCLTQACDELKLPYSFFDDNHNCICVTHKKRELFFVNCSTSFNPESPAEIAEDKYFTYTLCHTALPMPKTQEYVDPFVPLLYRAYATHATYQAIVADIMEHYAFPMIVKRNRGSHGNHVFLCQIRQEVEHAIHTIFNHRSRYYDYVALVQEYVPIVREFRAVVFQQKVFLLYEKDKRGAEFVGNLSPLHWKNAKAVHIQDTILVHKMQTFLQPFFTKLPLGYVGFDVAMLADSTLSLIEANTRPGFDYFIRDNGRAAIVELYKNMLTQPRIGKG